MKFYHQLLYEFLCKFIKKFNQLMSQYKNYHTASGLESTDTLITPISIVCYSNGRTTTYLL